MTAVFLFTKSDHFTCK